MFLIDSYGVNKFDFDLLECRLIEDFRKIKKAALLLALQATSKEMISLKVAELRSRMWKAAALSGTVELIPLPGLSMTMDIGVVTEESKFYFTQLDLDETSLSRYAELTKTDYQHLKSIVASSLGGFENRAIVDTCVKSDGLMAAAAAEEVLRCIPLIGSLIAAPLSYGGTYCALKLVLDKMERVALEVVECAAESAASACCDESVDDDDP